MKKERKPNNLTLEFLIDSLRKGYHLQKPRRVSLKNWTRMRNATGIYDGSPATLERTGEIIRGSYSSNLVTRERVRQMREKFIRHIHRKFPREERTHYPLSEILKGKEY